MLEQTIEHSIVLQVRLSPVLKWPQERQEEGIAGIDWHLCLTLFVGRRLSSKAVA